MPWWRRTPNPKPVPPTVEYPLRITLIAGELDVHIHRHELPVSTERLPCWTYVTDGLSRIGQPEISMTVLRANGEEAPHDPLRFFTTVHAFARQGRIVRHGQVTRFGGDDGPFGRHLAYIRQLPLAGITLPKDAIMAISITAEELEAVQSFGMLRVMARLGEQATYFPCPPWIDRARSGLSFERSARESVLMRVARLYCPELRVMRIGDRLDLRLSPTVRAFFTKHLASIPEDAPIALLADLDPAADALLLWESGEVRQGGFRAIAPVGSLGERVCGCFIVFVPVEGGGGAGMLEDGVRFDLRTEDWRTLRRALCEGGPFKLDAPDSGPIFAISWDDEWVTYWPKSPALPRAPEQRASLSGVRLLTAESVLAANTTGLELAAFCQGAERAICPILSRSPMAKELIVRFTCSPGKWKVDFAARPDLEVELREPIHRALVPLRLRVETDPIAFQLHFTVDG